VRHLLCLISTCGFPLFCVFSTFPLAILAESRAVLPCTNVGSPVILLEEDVPAAGAFRDTVDRFLGEEKELRFTTSEPVSFFRRIFG
jgi:septum site-determining protein MinD